MTTAALPIQAATRTELRGLELLVSRLAVGMLRWSQQRTARRRPTHEQMALLRQNQKSSANAADLSRLF